MIENRRKSAQRHRRSMLALAHSRGERRSVYASCPHLAYAKRSPTHQDRLEKIPLALGQLTILRYSSRRHRFLLSSDPRFTASAKQSVSEAKGRRVPAQGMKLPVGSFSCCQRRHSSRGGCPNGRSRCLCCPPLLRDEQDSDCTADDRRNWRDTGDGGHGDT